MPHREGESDDAGGSHLLALALADDDDGVGHLEAHAVLGRILDRAKALSGCFVHLCGGWALVNNVNDRSSPLQTFGPCWMPLSSSSPPHTQTHRRTFSICALTSLTSIVVVLVAPAHSADQSMGCLLLLRREGLRAALALLFFLWLVRLALPPSSFQARPPQERPRRLRCVTVCQEMVCEYVCVCGGGGIGRVVCQGRP